MAAHLPASILEPQADYFDAEVKGFGLRVTEHGTRSWIRIGDDPSKGKTRLTMGRFPRMNTEQAREKAKKLLELIARGA